MTAIAAAAFPRPQRIPGYTGFMGSMPASRTAIRASARSTSPSRARPRRKPAGSRSPQPARTITASRPKGKTATPKDGGPRFSRPAQRTAVLPPCAEDRRPGGAHRLAHGRLDPHVPRVSDQFGANPLGFQDRRGQDRPAVAVFTAAGDHLANGGQIVGDAPGVPVPGVGNLSVHEALHLGEQLLGTLHGLLGGGQIGVKTLQHRSEAGFGRVSHLVGTAQVIQVADQKPGGRVERQQDDQREQDPLDRPAGIERPRLQVDPGLGHQGTPWGLPSRLYRLYPWESARVCRR